MTYALGGKRVFVSGHRGMVGAALVRRLADEGCQILTAGREDLDLRRQAEVEAWMARHRPQAVFLVAAHQGGILAHHSRPAEILYDNLLIATHLIEAARQVAVEKLIFTGSAAAYPVDAPQPVAEEALLTGPPDAAHDFYAAAKVAGLKLCQAYRRQYGCDFLTAMPGNLYGPGAKFGSAGTNVIPGLIERFHAAKTAHAAEVVVWGSGRARREFLYVDDCADALVHLMTAYDGEGPVNLGSGTDVTIAQLAGAVAEAVGYEGRLVFDASKPEGAPRRLLDTARLRATGWTPSTALAQGLGRTYDWYLATVAEAA
jgi:GDP-L-fucose synthase